MPLNPADAKAFATSSELAGSLTLHVSWNIALRVTWWEIKKKKKKAKTVFFWVKDKN